jgi:hypothetical protein
MFDPKSLEALFARGDIEGLLCGLSMEDGSTRSTRNLLRLSWRNPVAISAPQPDDRSAFTASFDDPKRVYGKDILLTRISKTFL